MTQTPPSPTREEWHQRVEKELGPGRTFERDLVTRTLEGLPVAPLYTAEDLPRQAPEVSPLSGGWAVAQRVAHSSPRAANLRLLSDLREGATGVSIQMGAGPRHLRLRQIEDLDALLDGVFLDAIPITFSSSAHGLPLAAVFVALCRDRNVDPKEVAVHFGMDPIAALAGEGELPGTMDDARRELCTLAHHSRVELGQARALAVDAGTWQRAGGHAVLELGYALACFVEMLRWLEDSGLPPAAAQSEFVWRMDIGRDVFTEIAKLRAARVLHARVLGSAGIERAAPLMIHATTSERELTRHDPWTNMLRTSLGALAATAGGADIVTTLPFDSALGSPSELGRRHARNVQLIMERESHLDQVGDPARGSFAVEARTEALAREAWDLMRDIEAGGGFVAALRGGRVEDEIGAARASLRDEIARRARPIVGVSEFPAATEEDRAQTMEGGDAEASQPDGNAGDVVMGPIANFEHAIDAAAGGAAAEEIGRALGRGAAETVDPLPLFREASVFEDLVDAADRMDKRPVVFLACLGSPAGHGPLATFATHLFRAGGLDVVQGEASSQADALADAFSETGATIACLCGTQDDYDECGVDAVRALRERGARALLIARLGGDEPASAGVDDEVYPGCDAEALLRRLLELEGAFVPAPEVVA